MSVYALAYLLKATICTFAVLGNLFPNDKTAKSIAGRIICLAAAAACIGILVTL